MQYLYFTCTKKVETTGTFKYQKNKLKEEAFNPSKTSERLLALLPGASSYCDITTEILTIFRRINTVFSLFLAKQEEIVLFISNHANVLNFLLC